MSQTSIQEIRSLKVGRYIVIDGEPCKLVEYVTSKPGKHGEAKARMVAIGLFDGQKRSLVHPVKHKVHVPQVDRRKAQILANLGSEVQMMDLEDRHCVIQVGFTHLFLQAYLQNGICIFRSQYLASNL